MYNCIYLPSGRILHTSYIYKKTLSLTYTVTDFSTDSTAEFVKNIYQLGSKIATSKSTFAMLD